MLMNDKIMFAHYYCINSSKHCKKEENVGGLYFIALSRDIFLRMHAFIHMLDSDQGQVLMI